MLPCLFIWSSYKYRDTPASCFSELDSGTRIIWLRILQHLDRCSWGQISPTGSLRIWHGKIMRHQSIIWQSKDSDVMIRLNCLIISASESNFGASQLSERLEKSKPESLSFKASQYLAVRHPSALVQQPPILIRGNCNIASILTAFSKIYGMATQSGMVMENKHLQQNFYETASYRIDHMIIPGSVLSILFNMVKGSKLSYQTETL